MATGAGTIRLTYMYKKPATGTDQGRVKYMYRATGRQLPVENHGTEDIGRGIIARGTIATKTIETDRNDEYSKFIRDHAISLS
jgi:hypothetical protein